MNLDGKKTLSVARDFDATPEVVYNAWLCPDIARTFLFATPEGEMVRAEIDPRIGGQFLFVDRRAGVDIVHVGEYQQIDPPRRLAFSFAVPQFSEEFTRVIVDISPTLEGCRLTLTHEGVLPEWSESSEEGWRMILESLAQTLRATR